MHSENGMGKLELIGIVFNSVIFKLFIGTPENGIQNGGSAAWLSAAFCGFIFLAVLYTLLHFYTPYSQTGLTAAVKKRFKSLSLFISGAAAVFFSFSFLRSLSMTYSVLKAVRYATSPMWFIMIFLLFAILSTAFFGRTSVLRMHSLYIIGIGSIIIFILLLNLRRADVYNLAPILGNGAYNVFVKGLSDLTFYSGIIVIFFIPTNKISFSYRKTVMLSATAAVITNVLFTLIFSLGFCSEYAKTIDSPLFSLVKSASLGSLSARPDLLYLSAMISSAVLYLSLLLRIITTNLKRCLTFKKSLAVTAALCLLLPLSLCGCHDSNEIETNAYIVALGVDTSENEFEYTFQISNPLDSGGSIGAGKKAAENSDDESDGNKTVDNICINANNLYSAIDKLQSVLSKNINLSHMKLAVFSKMVASQSGSFENIGAMTEHCRLLMKEREVRPSVYLCLAESSKEYLTHVKPTLEKSAVSYYELFFGNSRVPFAPITQMQSFLNDCVDSSKAAVVPTVTENGLCGMGIFNGEFLADTLDSDAAMAYKILCGDLYGACVESENGKAVISVKKRPSVNVDLNDNSLTAHIKIHSDIQNKSGNIDVNSAVSNMLTKMLDRAYSEGCDILGIEKRLKSKFMTQSEADSSGIHSIVNNCKFLIDFD